MDRHGAGNRPGVFRAAAGAILALAALLSLSPAAAREPLVLGVHPFLPSTEIVRKFEPLARFLGRSTGRPVVVEVSRDYDDHIARVASGACDVAYMGPVSYVRLVEKHGAVPLLAGLETEGRRSFQGAIFVRRESPVQNIGDLAGRRVAFVSPSSTMGYIAPLSLLMEAGVPLERLASHSFLRNHENVALAVLAGDFDAGAVKEETFFEFREKGIRAVAMTPPVPEHLFVAAALPAEEIGAVREILLGLASSEEGMGALRAIKEKATNLVPVADGEYDALRAVLRRVEGLAKEQ